MNKSSPRLAAARPGAHADLNSVKLLDQTQLAELLKEFPVTMLDVEKLVFAEWGGRV
jgi:hypothetical protein